MTSSTRVNDGGGREHSPRVVLARSLKPVMLGAAMREVSLSNKVDAIGPGVGWVVSRQFLMLDTGDTRRRLATRTKGYSVSCIVVMV